MSSKENTRINLAMGAFVLAVVMLFTLPFWPWVVVELVLVALAIDWIA